MNVKYRIVDEVLRLLNEMASPEGQVDFWNSKNVDSHFDTLDISSLDKTEDLWQYTTQLKGTLRISLLIDQSTTPSIDARSINFDTFIDKVVNQEIIISPDDNVNTGEMSEIAQAQLIKLMEVPNHGLESIDSLGKKTHLIFAVNAFLLKKITASTRPEVWLGQSPDIGIANVDQYEKLG